MANQISDAFEYITRRKKNWFSRNYFILFIVGLVVFGCGIGIAISQLFF